MVERSLSMREVRGSIPRISTYFVKITCRRMTISSSKTDLVPSMSRPVIAFLPKLSKKQIQPSISIQTPNVHHRQPKLSPLIDSSRQRQQRARASCNPCVGRPHSSPAPEPTASSRFAAPPPAAQRPLHPPPPPYAAAVRSFL